MTKIKVKFIRATVVDGSVMPEGTEAEIDEATAEALVNAGVVERVDGKRSRRETAATERATSGPQRGS
jgi:hypothetical protein